MPIPVFVVGKGRSGTTWLATQLSRHPDIAGVCNDAAYGNIESAFFSHIYGRYGDLRKKGNFVEFVEVMSATDYFQQAGADREFLYSLPTRSYEEIFRIVMDEFARRNGAGHWLEKSPNHTRLISKIAGYYPDAKFVSITRDIEQVVASTLESYRRFPWLMKISRSRTLAILWTVMAWTYYKKLFKAFERGAGQIKLVKYEELVSDPETTFRGICEFLGVEYDSVLTEQVNRRNTNFRSSSQREDILSSAEKKMISIVATLSRLVPLTLMRAADRMWDRIEGRKFLPPSHFRQIKLPAEYKNENKGDLKSEKVPT